jgi:hypothetical protein
MRLGLMYGTTDLTRWLLRSSEPITLTYADEFGKPTIPEVNVSLSNIDGDLPDFLLSREIATLTFDGVVVFTGYVDGDTISYDFDKRILRLTLIGLERGILDELKFWSLGTLPLVQGERGMYPTLDDMYGPVRYRFFRNVRLLLQLIVQRMHLDWAPNLVRVPDTLYFGGAEFGTRDWAPSNMTYYDFISLVADALNAVWFVQSLGPYKPFYLMPLREYLSRQMTEQPFTFPALRNSSMLGKRIGYDRVEIKFNGTLAMFQQTTPGYSPGDRIRRVEVAASALYPQDIVNHSLGRLPIIRQADVRDLLIHIEIGSTFNYTAFDAVPYYTIDHTGDRELTEDVSLLDADYQQWATLGSPWRYLRLTPGLRYFCRSIEFNPRDDVARIVAWGFARQ